MPLSFSSRLPASLAPNPISRALAELRGETPVLDLTETNPTKVGLVYPPDLLQPLAQPEGLHYRPTPFGLLSAREAIARHYAEQGESVSPERIILCASTSEAYSWLFKLLCNPGEGALAPRPGYPLFDGLAELEAIHLDFYDSYYDERWSIDLAHVESLISPATRILLTVSPNNPTGSLTRADDQQALEKLCCDYGLALVRDEVFAEYLLEQDGRRGSRPSTGGSGSTPTALFHPGCLTFRLGGLSKLAGLPQLKLAWILVDGPDAMVHEALTKLEFIADTFLSVGTPIQLALPELLIASAPIRDQIRSRTRQNLHHLKTAMRAHPALEVLRIEGGWSAVIRVPAIQKEEEIVLSLLREHHVLVHPGYFFNFHHETYLVVSLLQDPAVFANGVSKITMYFEGRL